MNLKPRVMHIGETALKNEATLKYLNSVRRVFISGTYGTEKGQVILKKKLDALNLASTEIGEIEQKKVSLYKKALSFLITLSDDSSFSSLEKDEFFEYSEIIGLTKEEAIEILENIDTLRELECEDHQVLSERLLQ